MGPLLLAGRWGELALKSQFRVSALGPPLLQDGFQRNRL